MNVRNVLVAVVLSSLSIAPLDAQQQPSTSAAIDVPVTNLTVVVTDGKGNAVTGLKAEDLEVTVNGQPRPITNFSEIGIGPSVMTPRQIMFVFDNTSLTMPSRKPFIAAARAFARESLLPTDKVMVVALSQKPEIRLDWTTDRDELDHVFGAVEIEATTGRAELQRRRTEQELRSTLTGDQIGASSVRGSSTSFDALTTTVRNYAQVSMFEASQTAGSLSAALNWFDRAADRKVVVMAGGGLPVRPGADMWQYLETLRGDVSTGGGSAAMKRSARNATPLNESSEFNLAPMLREIGSSAKRRGIVIYALNPGNSENAAGGVENQRSIDLSSDFEKVAGAGGGYQLIAAATGGLAFNGTRPAVALPVIGRDLRNGYSLGFRPAASDKPEMAVVRAKSGSNVRTFLGAMPVSPEEMVEQTVIANHLVAPAANAMKIALAADPAVADGAKRRVPLKVMIPVKSLKFATEGSEVVGGFNVYISTGDSRGNASDVNRQTQQLRWPADALPHLMEKSVTFAVDVVLEEGRDQISVGVLDPRSQASGFERIAIAK